MSTFLPWVLFLVFAAVAVLLLVKALKAKKAINVIAFLVVCSLAVFVGSSWTERELVLPIAVSPTEDKEEGEDISGAVTLHALPTEERDDCLLPTVAAMEPISVEGGTVAISVIGAQVTLSGGNVQLDREIVGAGLKGEAYKDGLNRTKHMDFVPAEAEKVAQMDAFLSLYIRFELPVGGEEAPVIPALDIAAVDDRGGTWLPIYYSHERQSIDAAQPYGIIILKGYRDAAKVDITLGSTLFSLAPGDFEE